MLANGAKLGYRLHSDTGIAGTFTDLPGLKEIPELGLNKEKVENTVLTDSLKKYELGIGDPGDITYKFKYANTSENSPYRVMRQYEESETVLDFQETLKDGTTTTFTEVTVSVKRSGGGVNGVIEFDLILALQGDMTTEDPA